MKNKKIAALIVVSVLIICSSTYAVDSDASSSEGYVMFDMGNGETVWSHVDTSGGDTLSDVFAKAAVSNDIDYKYSGGKITINGLDTRTVGTGSGSGSITVPGTTSKTVTSSWKLFSWDGSKWTSCSISDLSAAYVSGSYALGFYPDNVVPVETPSCQNAWTMMRGDSRQTGSQTATFSATTEAVCKWKTSDEAMGACGSALYAQGLIFIKYGSGTNTHTEKESALICYDLDGNVKWSFIFPGIEYFEVMTPVIAGDYIYVTSGLGHIFKLPWRTGPGDDNCNVTMIGNVAYDKTVAGSECIPYKTTELTGTTYSTGCGNLIYDSGCIYCMASNGMIYCFNTDLELIWSYQMSGCAYFISPTVYDGYVFGGAYNGYLYILDQCTGSEIVKKEIYSVYDGTQNCGCVSAVSVFKEGANYHLFASVNDGKGMNKKSGGLMHSIFNGTGITYCYVNTDNYGLVQNYLLPVESESFTGVYFVSTDGLFRVDLSEKYANLNDGIGEVHSPLILVNDGSIYSASYSYEDPNLIMDMNGKVLRTMMPVYTNYCMAPPLIIDDFVLYGNDSGSYCIYGVMPEYIAPSTNGTSVWVPIAITLGVIAAVIAGIWCGLRFIAKKDRPFKFLFGKISDFINGKGRSHNTKNKRRLWIVLGIGLVLLIIMFFISLTIGTGGSLSVGEAWSALCSAIGKGGNNLNYNETVVYSSRLPRILAAIAVGMGLSIAGSIYQAIIRNPLVDPYIMGVSSGAGTAAVAVIAFDFTFFGLFSSHSPYLIAISAIVGGIIAFFCTMLIAEKAGGSSINYVLAGVVVGLAFSAVQTIMMSMAGDNVSNALTWLFGSFSNVSWTQVWMIVIPAVALSLVPLIWAKEFNLVLIGEDQAKQMGLNVRVFTICMLTLASTLTAICVAFVGIIGFIGLVVPHLCRMILGGDHRLVMPSSIVIGAFLMLLADFASRMLLAGQELPVGAITTIIGVPVFAWLLIKRGRRYDG